MLQAPPEPHCKYVRIDQRASQTLINYCLMTNFACKRVGFLYGQWVSDDSGNGVEVHSIYEVPRHASDAPRPVHGGAAAGLSAFSSCGSPSRTAPLMRSFCSTTRKGRRNSPRSVLCSTK